MIARPGLDKDAMYARVFWKKAKKNAVTNTKGEKKRIQGMIARRKKPLNTTPYTFEVRFIARHLEKRPRRLDLTGLDTT